MTRFTRFGALVGATLFALAGAVSAQTVTLRYTTGAPPKTPWVTQAERLAAHVGEESKGAVKLDLFIAAQLGNEQDTIQQVARGRIDMGGFSTTGVAVLVPDLALFSLPFYFRSLAEQDCVLDALAPDIAGLLEAKNIKFLGWSDVGASDIIGKKAFVSPADARGIKAAANQHRISALMWSTLGANPNPLGITEIVGAFQTGMVDVQSQVVTFYVPSGLNKVAPVLTRMNLSHTPGLIVMNKGVWDKLAPDHKAAFDKASARVPAAQLRQEVRGFEQALRDLHVKGGGQVVETTADQREEWRKLLQPAWPEMVKSVNGEALFGKIEAGRAKCGRG